VRDGIQDSAIAAAADAANSLLAEARAGRRGLLSYVCPLCFRYIDIADFDANGDAPHDGHVLHVDLDSLAFEPW
jgi:hypothetical protein